MLNIPEGMFPVSMIKPRTTNGGFTTDYVSLKNAVMAWVVVHLTQAVGHATLFSPYRATDVAASDTAVLVNVVPIWYGNVSTTSNALTRQTDAVNYTMLVGVTGEAYIIYQIDPANLGTTFDCIAMVVANSGQVTNLVDITCWIQPKYPSRTADQLSYIAD